jgi:hypothetical protein
MKVQIRLFHYFPAVLLALVIAISCSKHSTGGGSNNTDTAVSATTNLTSKPWKYDTSGLDLNNDGKIDVGGDTTVVHLCQRDDLYTFNKDNTGSVNTGSLHCTVGEAQTMPFTWSLSTDNKTLKASFYPVLQQGVTLLTLDSLHLSGYHDTLVLGVNYRLIVQLKH